MTLVTAAEFAVMFTAADLQEPLAAWGAGQLSRRERELVTLVAQGCTDAQIAGAVHQHPHCLLPPGPDPTRPAAAAAPT